MTKFLDDRLGEIFQTPKPKRKKKNQGGSAGENSMVRQAQRNYTGSYISGDLGGVQVSNPSYKKYYQGMI